MRFAFIEGRKAEAQPGLRGSCPCCGSEVIAKCGRFKIRHWAHKNKTNCDPWWENESEWHRKWKSYFPAEWQEVVLQATNLERHIADVYTPNQCVLEFQMSSIDEIEVRAREGFYQNLSWVVNGQKNDFDKVYFNLSLKDPDPCDHRIRNFRWWGKSKLFHRWSSSTKPVYMDFGGDLVWQILSFDTSSKKGTVRAIEKEEFVRYFGGTYLANNPLPQGLKTA